MISSSSSSSSSSASPCFSIQFIQSLGCFVYPCLLPSGSSSSSRASAALSSNFAAGAEIGFRVFFFYLAMAQSAGRGRVVGDYLVGRQIGSGSFSVVWHARHRVHGTEVAIKEIVAERLNKKLQESLKSEISTLKNINHPNIIRLHEIIEVNVFPFSPLEQFRGWGVRVSSALMNFWLSSS